MKWWGGGMWADDQANRAPEPPEPINLNGWQRLWVVLAIMWCVPIGAFLVATAPHPYDREYGGVAALVVIIPPSLLYLGGLAVAWIRRGFRE
jgi:hypothetical protein